MLWVRGEMSEHSMPNSKEEIRSDNMHTDESLQSLMGFRLKPRLAETINTESIKEIIRDVQKSNLDEKTWNDLDPKITCTTITNSIKEYVKNNLRLIRIDFRYKFIVQTVITKFDSQSVTLKTRCIWDVKTDRLVFENYINDYIICSSEVIFIYFY